MQWMLVMIAMYLYSRMNLMLTRIMGWKVIHAQRWGKNVGLKVKSGKGRRLVVLHAITLDGPLCERMDDGRPIDDLKWSGSTCHPGLRMDGQLTCETLWVAQSHTGDYHDNMTSKMLMRWVQEKLCPTFKKLYPGEKIIFITDNASYYHAREIGSIWSLSKNLQ